MNETKTCSQSGDLTRARVTDYVADIFTTEDHLTDAVSMLGATATNIAVTANLVFYGGGLYYNPEECVDYVEEPVPVQCQEERDGRISYTCLTVEGVDCAEMMPKHCDIFFKQSDTSFPHSLTVVGFDEEEDGTQYWRMKNSWGPTWGEEGYLRLARGLGHCGVGGIFTVPICTATLL